MADYNRADLERMQAEAVRRVRDMQAKARRNLRDPSRPDETFRQAEPPRRDDPFRQSEPPRRDVPTPQDNPFRQDEPPPPYREEAARAPQPPRQSEPPPPYREEAARGPQPPRQDGRPKPAKNPLESLFSGIFPSGSPTGKGGGFLNLLNLKALNLDSDRALILVIFVLLASEDADELLLLALLYIML